MRWLSSHHAILNCYAKIAIVSIPSMETLEWKGTFRPTTLRIMLDICAQKLVKWGLGNS